MTTLWSRLCSKVKEKLGAIIVSESYVSHKPLREKIAVFHLESAVSFRVVVSLVCHKSQ